MDYTINVRGQLLDLGKPVVMGILNVTPDSFYADSRTQTEREIAVRAHQIVEQGGAIIDVGACSTRPQSTPVSADEELRRLRLALSVIKSEVPEALISIDTFRPEVARVAVEEYGADIINDVGAPASPPSSLSSHLSSAPEMFHMVSRLGVPYVLTSQQATLPDMLITFARDVQMLRDLGQKDIILDPGFGFGKTLQQNYEVLSRMERILVMELPVLVGVSRKSMIYKSLGIQPETSLNGTTVLNTIALSKGASILRVHDVKEAVECCRLVEQLKG